jgi:UDP-N-acetyl-D-glucosamine dehydrogenase
MPRRATRWWGSTRIHARSTPSPSHDPHVPELPDLEIASVPLEESLAAADLVCIVTAHSSLDYREVVERSPLVLDFRGVTRDIEAANLVRL